MLAKGIEKGEEATEKVKDASSTVVGTAKGKADETSEVGKQKANQVRLLSTCICPSYFDVDISQASADVREKKEEFKKSI